MLGEAREMHCPLWQTKKKLDTNTERVPTLLVTLSIRINMT